MKKALFTAAKQSYRFISSLGLASVLFLLLLLLTYLGTIEQTEHGLYETQNKYFESLFLVHRFFGDTVPVLLPGAYLLLILLFFNILFGGIARVWGHWNKIGVFIAHAGILILLVGSIITFRYGRDGHVTLYENESAAVFKSYHEWEIAVREYAGNGGVVEHVIPDRAFVDLDEGEERTFQSAAFPFDVVLSGFHENCTPRQVKEGAPAGAAVVDGYFLQPIPSEKQHERNVAGVHLQLEGQTPDADHQFLLWGFQQAPAAVTIRGSKWTFDLRRRQWELPFTVTLNKFTRKLHPGTSMPAEFSSDVTKTEGDVARDIKISMNEPLRHKGYTLYQASWGPQNAKPGDRLFSTFAVVRNPADLFPMYACVVITLGMVIHYMLKLRRYLRREMRSSQ